jgi:hypothetical protein
MNHISDRTAQWPHISESQNQGVQAVTQLFVFGRCIRHKKKMTDVKRFTAVCFWFCQEKT